MSYDPCRRKLDDLDVALGINPAKNPTTASTPPLMLPRFPASLL